MFGSPTIYKPIITSMCNVSHESENQNIFFITWGIITFLSNSLYGRFIILCSMSMMSSLVSLLLVRDIFVSRTFSSIVSFLVTCITSDSRQIFSSVIFVKKCLPLGWWELLLVFLECIVRAWSSLPIFSSRVAIRAYSWEHSSHSLLNLTNLFLA